MNMKLIIKNNAMLIFFMIITINLFIITDAYAPYSDYYSNRQSGATSSNLALKHGETYSGAARNYMNYRHGYGTGRNRNYYSTYPYGSPYRQYANSYRHKISPEQKRQINQLLKQSEALERQILNDPRIWK